MVFCRLAKAEESFSLRGGNISAGRKYFPLTGEVVLNQERENHMLQNQLSHSLKQFHGSEQFHRYHNLIMTEGVEYLARAAGCYWLLDVAWSYVSTEEWSGEERFVTLKLRVRKKKKKAGAWVIFDNGNGAILAKQYIHFTDFPLGRMTLWMCWNGEGYTIMLPSEY